MRAPFAVGPTVHAAAAAEAALSIAAPGLVAGFMTNLSRAADVVARRLVGAAQREGLAGTDLPWEGDRAFFPLANGGYLVARARRHAFGRVEVAELSMWIRPLWCRGSPGAPRRHVDSRPN